MLTLLLMLIVYYLAFNMLFLLSVLSVMYGGIRFNGINPLSSYENSEDVHNPLSIIIRIICFPTYSVLYLIKKIEEYDIIDDSRD